MATLHERDQVATALGAAAAAAERYLSTIDADAGVGRRSAQFRTGEINTGDFDSLGRMADLAERYGSRRTSI